MIGEGNKEISILRAESGLIDTQMRQLYAEIGRYVSRNTQPESRLRRRGRRASRLGRRDARPAPLDRAQPPPRRQRLIEKSVSRCHTGASRSLRKTPYFGANRNESRNSSACTRTMQAPVEPSM